ncbi:MAG TPA: thymidine phosphorylase [Gemmatimonadales bacterium]|nr:thymidine phosphorylase [Gemmatimonadales bacterium]
MFVPGLIERKRDGGALSAAEWRELLDGYLAGRVPDYQVAALLMACFLRGMDRAETAALLDAMMASGSRLDFSHLGLPVVDKHSTGGVGDKVSLVLAPLVACCGIAVPMMSGRGLGHTGGTLDKLESIPGFRTNLPLAEARAQVERIGCVLIGQTPEIAPVDRKLYALRDVTATVECIPLIAASIMSKKLSVGLTALVLDVKQGSGAFIPDADRSLELARTMLRLGEDRGCPTVALLTAMDRPLGRACGNALEVEEAINALRGEGPQDLLEVTLALAVEMVALGRKGGTVGGRDEDTRTAIRQELEAALSSGRAARKFQEIIAAQGGNPAVVDDPAVLPQAKSVDVYEAPRGGVITEVAPRPIGRAVVELGGGRRRMDDVVDPTVGFVITARVGSRVERGEPLASIFARDEAGIALARAALDSAISIGEGAPSPLPLVAARVTAEGVEELT